MTIDVVFDPPTPLDGKDTFKAKAQAVFALLNAWSGQANAAVGAAQQGASDADAAKDLAQQAQGMAEQAVLDAAHQVDLATQQAGLAASAAIAAATTWVSDASYAQNKLVWAGATGSALYRCIQPHSGRSTPPQNDPGYWAPVAGVDITQSPTDTTPGRILKVGDFGIGKSLDFRGLSWTTGTPSDYLGRGYSSGFIDGHDIGIGPSMNYGTLEVFSQYSDMTGANGSVMRRFTSGTSGGVFISFPVDATTWGPWVELIHTGNLADVGLLDVPTSTVTSAAYTLQLADRGNCVDVGHTITVPKLATVAFPKGSVINLQNVTAGNITITAESGATVRQAGDATKTGPYTLKAYGWAVLRKIDTASTWVISGAGI